MLMCDTTLHVTGALCWPVTVRSTLYGRISTGSRALALTVATVSPGSMSSVGEDGDHDPLGSLFTALLQQLRRYVGAGMLMGCATHA